MASTKKKPVFRTKLAAAFAAAVLLIPGVGARAQEAAVMDAPVDQMRGAVPRRDANLPDLHKLEIQFSLAAFDTIKAKDVCYVSVPITSGARLYSHMDARGIKTPEEAKKDRDAFFKGVIAPNIDSGERMAETLAQKNDCAVIAPTSFEKRFHSQKSTNWGQDEFMSLWIGLIDAKVTKMVMIDGWEYSNGSGEEYLQAALMQMGRAGRSNISVVDTKGEALTPDKTIRLMADAFKDVHRRGLKARNMAETLALMLAAEERYAAGMRENGCVVADVSMLPPYDRGVIAAAALDVRPIFERDYPDILKVVEKHASCDFTPANALFRAAGPRP